MTPAQIQAAIDAEKPYATYFRFEGDGQFGIHHEARSDDPGAQAHFTEHEVRSILARLGIDGMEATEATEPADPFTVSAALRRLIADDAYAATFQTFGQYRMALLKAIDNATAAAGVSVARPEGSEPSPTDGGTE